MPTMSHTNQMPNPESIRRIRLFRRPPFCNLNSSLCVQKVRGQPPHSAFTLIELLVVIVFSMCNPVAYGLDAVAPPKHKLS